MPPSADLHHQTHSRPLFAVDGNVDEGRNADKIQSSRGDVATGDRDRLNRLVDRTRSDRLELNPVLGSDYARNRPGYPHWLRGRRDLEYFHWGGGAPAGG